MIFTKNQDTLDNSHVIAVMGPTGSGKSNFIDTLTGKPLRAGDGLASCTQKVQAIRVPQSKYEDRLVLVDTPGFNDTERSDMEILKNIGDWLKKTYQDGKTLSGIIYVHRITDNRLAGTPHRNLRMFGELCGDKAAGKVILVSTMWDKVKEPIGELREQQLRTQYWAAMINHGATAMRFDNSKDSAWKIVDSIINKKENEEAAVILQKEAVLLQEELVDLKLRLNETKAGIALYDGIQLLLAKQLEIVRQLESDANRLDQPEVAAAMQEEERRIRSELEATTTQLKAMKIPLTRRIALLFKGKARAEPLVVG